MSGSCRLSVFRTTLARGGGRGDVDGRDALDARRRAGGDEGGGDEHDAAEREHQREQPPQPRAGVT
eukprot:CAMPEP_0119394982 /NCGR_PEP_ID=MMETSP1334-20130426/131617_1 /TAXON_ID=127549 /ORGANISM="Calcidiscus leptoporus, Strain RCC1130" /LENGTH=65 /DNA_ID=CAMNT_0007418379 /DNA_START=769 /DNA_END=963 /DNA_ORIENTATION=-